MNPHTLGSVGCCLLALACLWCGVAIRAADLLGYGIALLFAPALSEAIRRACACQGAGLRDFPGVAGHGELGR
jgi:hypothetical protein